MQIKEGDKVVVLRGPRDGSIVVLRGPRDGSILVFRVDCFDRFLEKAGIAEETREEMLASNRPAG